MTIDILEMTLEQIEQLPDTPGCVTLYVSKQEYIAASPAMKKCMVIAGQVNHSLPTFIRNIPDEDRSD